MWLYNMSVYFENSKALCGCVCVCACVHDIEFVVILPQEYQLMIGLGSWMLWVAYFFTFFCLYVINIVFICAVLFVKASVILIPVCCGETLRGKQKYRTSLTSLVAWEINSLYGLHCRISEAAWFLGRLQFKLGGWIFCEKWVIWCWRWGFLKILAEHAQIPV